MKPKLKMMVSASAATLVALAAFAQAPNNTNNTNSSRYMREGMAGSPSARLNGAAKASDVIGMTVKNYQDEKLGDVDDLAIDLQSGRIVQVILSTGGFLGLGDTLTAVPPGALHYDMAQKIIHLDANKEKLKDAPKFNKSHWDENTQSNHVNEVYAYFGGEPYYAGQQGFDATRAALNSNRNADGTRTMTNNPNWNRKDSSWTGMGYVQKASKLIGSTVKNLQDEKLGDVDNLLVDLTSGRIVAVVISSGGFLGMGDELSAVPPTALRYGEKGDNLQLDASKEMLSQAPHFKSDHWPDFAEPGYAGGVYRAYGVEPYFSNDSTNDADNSRRNVRDRGDRTLTPTDQSNNRTDIDLTAQIRKAITGTDNLSVNAQNVKIITRNGQVTLRGPVKTAQEKSLIGDIASRIASSGNVDNQLEVENSK